jgi:hypothetical protein
MNNSYIRQLETDAVMRYLGAAVATLTMLTCSGPAAIAPVSKHNHIVTPAPVSHVLAVPVLHVLAPALEAELDQIRRAPFDAVGFGEKAFLPYDLTHGERLARDPDPAVVPRLAGEALDPRNDLVFRFVMLQILGLRREAAVDEALMKALADPMLRPLAAFFLGRPGYKGYPARDRPTTEPLLRALAAHLHDAGVYDDPWYQERHATADLVVAAFVRIAGPERFTFADPSQSMSLGYMFWFPASERAGLLAQAERWFTHEGHEPSGSSPAPNPTAP